MMIARERFVACNGAFEVKLGSKLRMPDQAKSQPAIDS